MELKNKWQEAKTDIEEQPMPEKKIKRKSFKLVKFKTSRGWVKFKARK